MSEFDLSGGTPKLAEFTANDGPTPIRVSFVETLHVKDGVECDTYKFDDDPSKDLAIVTVLWVHKTPLQRVLSGAKTIEGFVRGEGTLTVTSADGEVKTHEFGPTCENRPVEVKIGETMQWAAFGAGDLVFYELCEPPYKDGRFENLAE